MEKKQFHVGTIVSVVYGILVTPDSPEGRMAPLYEILNFMTGDNLFTRQLPRASRACEPHLREILPNLCGEAMDARVDFLQTNLAMESHPGIKAGFVDAWLRDIVAVFGEMHDVTPLPAGVWLPKDPVQEMVDMRCDKETTIVVVGGK